METKKVLILVVVGLLVMVSISFADFFAGIEVGTGSFSIAGGMDTGSSLIELTITPMNGTIGFGGGYTQLIGKIYDGKVGDNGTIVVHWGAGGSVYFASVSGYSLFGIGVGPVLIEHLVINKIKLLFTQMAGITYTPGIRTEYGTFGGGISFGISGGIYYEF